MTLNSKQLRKETLQSRDSLTKEIIQKDSRTICEHLCNLPEIKNCTTIFVYVSFRSEVATFELIETLLAAGKTVTVPITYVKERRLDAIQIRNLVKDLVPGYCNIPEPTPELCKNAIISPNTIEAIILPGSVFDKRGGRFGYGGGFYDRFVSAIPKATRIGLAYDLQVVDELTLQAHDEMLDYVITPSQTYKSFR
ncbi:5-formyltetrahydrofolate cyclo-ligase [Desulforhopalus sp. 52FAK]